MKPQVQKENPWLNLFFNIVLPSLALAKLSTPDRLGPLRAFLLSVSIPLIYGVFDFFRSKKPNFFSIIGLVSLVLTGGLGLLQLDGFWFAVKEASIPTAFCLAVFGSGWLKKPLIRSMLMNDAVLQKDLIDQKIAEKQLKSQVDSLVLKANAVLGASFALSAVLNFVLARVILKSPSGSEAFNSELARMNLLSWVVITVPSMLLLGTALWMLLKGISGLTGLTFEQMLPHQEDSKKEPT